MRACAVLILVSGFSNFGGAEPVVKPGPDQLTQLVQMYRGAIRGQTNPITLVCTGQLFGEWFRAIDRILIPSARQSDAYREAARLTEVYARDLQASYAPARPKLATVTGRVFTFLRQSAEMPPARVKQNSLDGFALSLNVCTDEQYLAVVDRETFDLDPRMFTREAPHDESRRR